MTNLTAARNCTTRESTGGPANIIAVPGTNAVVFYAGGFVCLDTATGLAVKPADTATFHFLGIVRKTVTADGAQGDSEVTVITGPLALVRYNVVGVDNINDVGDLVYLTDDNVLTLSATANTKAIGYVSRYYGSSTLCDVELFAPGESRAL